MSYCATEKIKSMRGLTPKEVEAAKQLNGENALIERGKRSFFGEFLSNFGDPIIKILLVALVVNVIIMIRHFNWYESIGIAAAILISTFVSTLSEYGSEAAFEKMQAEALTTNCRVMRSDGLAELPVAEVVTGDLVLLQAGDRIPADGAIVYGEIDVDQSPLNGESKEVKKTPPLYGHPDARTGFDNANSLFRGCIVCSGDAIMLVHRVGIDTFYGSLAHELQEESRESPLKSRLGNLAKQISRLGYIGAFLVAFADLFNSLLIAYQFNFPVILKLLSMPKELISHLIHAVTLAISVIVVAIPEGLPLMITIVLSSNMKRMLKDNVLVRKLVGIETSGNINILFTDKTGTITTGRLKANSFVLGNGTIFDGFTDMANTRIARLLKLSILYNTSASIGISRGKKQAIGGNATERALLEYVWNDRQQFGNIAVSQSLPFNSVNKYSACRIKGEINATLIKGAPEKILPFCTHFYTKQGERQPLSNTARVQSVLNSMATRGIRLLAFATDEKEISRDGKFGELTLLGVIGIRDEIRRKAVDAIRQVEDAGVQVVMITGDNRDTALAIAKESGLIRFSQEDAVLTSADLQRMTDRDLKIRLPKIRVIARALPADKSRLVRVAQDMGLVTGMTGDGINDAPALKRADVGFSMGSGTEIAKEASDIVILDDNFLSISKAILYGRTIFKSIRKFIVFQLTINLCAVGISIIGPFIGINSPITVLQMLWVNMVMDTLAGLAFAGEAPLKEYMREPPKRRDEPIINAYMYNQILISGIYVTVLCVLFLKVPAIRSMYDHGNGRDYFMTAFFSLFIFAGIFNSFNSRTSRLMLFAHIWRNKGFLLIMLFVTIVQLVIIYFGGAVFRTTGLSVSELQFVLISAFTVIPVDLLRKICLGASWRGSAI